jgi:hypothetical protein
MTAIESREKLARVVAVVVALFASTAGCACAEDEAAPPSPPETLPEQVSVPARQVAIGTANGTLRKEVAVGGFRITRFPITVREWRECVAARACGAPARTHGSCASRELGTAGQTYASEAGERDAFPVTCTTPEQARAYCGWLGARLPAAEEWLHAARGPEVMRYSWGSEPVSCERHPVAIGLPGDSRCCPDQPGGCKLEEALRVGRHPDGQSPAGLEDVLLAPAELLAFAEQSPVPACRSSEQGCLAATISGASIDAIYPAPGPDSTASGVPVWAFRCAWDG